MAWKFLLTAAAAAVLAVANPQAQPDDPMLGTWTLNTAKSKTTYKSGTSTIAAVDGAIKVTAEIVAADGTRYAWEWTAKYGGPDAAITGTTPFGSGATASMTRVDARTVKVIGKRNGKTILTQTIVVAPDGRSRTVTTVGTDTKGQPVDVVAVYDRK
jgi:hypothetical protein